MALALLTLACDLPIGGCCHVAYAVRTPPSGADEREPVRCSCTEPTVLTGGARVLAGYAVGLDTSHTGIGQIVSEWSKRAEPQGPLESARAWGPQRCRVCNLGSGGGTPATMLAMGRSWWLPPPGHRQGCRERGTPAGTGTAEPPARDPDHRTARRTLEARADKLVRNVAGCVLRQPAELPAGIGSIFIPRQF